MYSWRWIDLYSWTNAKETSSHRIINNLLFSIKEYLLLIIIIYKISFWEVWNIYLFWINIVIYRCFHSWVFNNIYPFSCRTWQSSADACSAFLQLSYTLRPLCVHFVPLYINCSDIGEWSVDLVKLLRYGSSKAENK